MIKPQKAMKKLGRDIKDVLIISKQAIKHESPILIKKGKRVLKKYVKCVKYKKRKVKGIRKQLGHENKINMGRL